MDPLSMVASIVAVLQLTTSVMTYVNDASNATGGQKKVAIEASTLYGLLLCLRNRVEEARKEDEVWFAQVRALGAKDGPLDQFKQILEKIAGQINTSRTRDRVKSALIWTFDKSEVEMSLQQIERLKSLIQLALSDDMFALSRAIHQEVIDLSVLTRQVQTGVEKLHVHANQIGDLQVKLSNWLNIPDPSTNYHAALKKRHVGTGSWLLKGQVFQDWKSSKSSLIWLHGNAGCGKTILSATVLENILGDTSGQTGTVVTYFYFDFNDTLKQNSSTAVRSLLFQFAIQLPEGFQTLEQLYRGCRDGQQQPTDDQIHALLSALIGQANRSYVILDALDECHDRHEFLPFIHSLTATRQYSLCILATSRREQDIYVSLGPTADKIINIQSAVVNPDINAYICGRLETDKKLQKWSPAVKQKIVDELMSKSEGMFRWAYCQLEVLCKCRQRRDLEKALLELPKDLDGTYARILQSIESNNDLPSALTILRWLCFSDRPLRLSELVDVLAIENRSDGSGGFDPEERLPDPDDVMEICSSLISCHATVLNSTLGGEQNYKTFDNTFYDENLKDDGQESDAIWVRLAHFSVKEYLVSDRCLFPSDFLPYKCYSDIGESCLHYLQYLSQEGTLSHELIQSHPLADYAAEFWWQHMQEASRAHGATATMAGSDLTFDFLTDDQCLLTWLRLNDADKPWKGQTLQKPLDSLAPALYYAAFIGLSAIVEKIIAQGADVNARGGYYSNALYAASERGHEKIVRILIDAKADVNARGGNYSSALQAASAGGHEKVVRMLIDAKANVDALRIVNYPRIEDLSPEDMEITPGDRSRYGCMPRLFCDNALYVASEQGHEKVVRMLIDARADINTRVGWSGYEGEFNREAHYALQAASEKGHERIVRMLIDAKADVNAQGGGYGNALYAASAGGHEKVVQILIDAKADVNAQGGYYGNALHAASYGGHEKVVQMLVATGGKHLDEVRSDD